MSGRSCWALSLLSLLLLFVRRPLFTLPVELPNRHYPNMPRTSFNAGTSIHVDDGALRYDDHSHWPGGTIGLLLSSVVEWRK